MPRVLGLRVILAFPLLGFLFGRRLSSNGCPPYWGFYCSCFYGPCFAASPAKRSRSGLRLDVRDQLLRDFPDDGSSSDFSMEEDGDYVVINAYKHRALRSLFRSAQRKSIMIRLSQGNPPPPLLPEPEKPLQTSWIKLLVGSSVDRVHEAGYRLYRCGAGSMPPRRLSCASKYRIQSADEGQLIAAFRSSAHLEVNCFEFSLRLGFPWPLLYCFLDFFFAQVSRMKKRRIKTQRSTRGCPSCVRPLGSVPLGFLFALCALVVDQALCLNGLGHGAILIFGGSCFFHKHCSFDQVLSSGQASC